MAEISDLVLQQFRALALERLARVEVAWAQVMARVDEGAARVLQREIHTLKGESRVVGFDDVNLVCHKLEDLLDAAVARGYAVDDEFDLAVNMAIQFMMMLVRRRAGSQLAAIDLPGFVRQIEGVLAHQIPTPRTRTASIPPGARAPAPRIPPAIRGQLGPAAVDVFIEYATAKGARRDRLRTTWHQLRDLIGVQRAVLGADQLAKHRDGAARIAAQLGKQVELQLELAPAEVSAEALGALDVAALHLVRNAVDHGVEPPAERVAAGKPARGTIRLRGGLVGESYVLAVEDDGRGIDTAAVAARAAELGLITAGARPVHERPIGDGESERAGLLINLLCHPGLSTRREASDVSGRGLGLDAARSTLGALGGALAVTSTPGQGTTFTAKVPVAQLSVSGLLIRAPGLRFPVVIAPGWQLLERLTAPVLVDLAVALGMPPSNSISSAVWGFMSGGLEVGLLSGEKPVPAQARRLIMTPPTAVAEVVTVDTVEGLLVRPDRIPGVLPG